MDATSDETETARTLDSQPLVDAAVSSPDIIVPRRKIIIEPLLVIVSIIAFPMALLTQQFIVYKITKDKGIVMNGTNGSTDNQCDVNTSSEAYLIQQEIQAEAAQFNIYNTLCYCIPALFVTLFLGSFSDKYGRKFAILPPLVGLMVRTLSYVLVICLDLPLWYLLIGGFFEGFGGSFTALLMGCFAYIADITNSEQRQFRITVVELIMFMSGILGPIGVGVWIQEMGYLPPMLMVLGGNVVCVLYVIFLVPETVVRKLGVKPCDCSFLQKVGALFLKDDGTNRRWKLCTLIISFFIVATVDLGSSVTTLFMMNSPLCWGSAMLGYFTAAYIGVGAPGGIALAKLLKFCVTDNVIALLACLDCVIKSIYTGFVVNTVMMYCGIIFAPLSLLYFPTMRAIMSKLVAPLEQGTLFGAIAFVEVLCSMIGTVSNSSIYRATLDIHTGFVFFYYALVFAIGGTILLVYVILDWKQKKETDHRTLLINEEGEEEE